MKTQMMKSWMAAMLLSGACCGFVACENNDDNNTPPAEPDATAAIGAYSGTMAVFQLAPSENLGEESTDTQLDATVTSEAVLFENFPIRDLVIQVLGDEALADQIVEKIGKVDYSVPYTALMSEDKASVLMTLTPEPLRLTFLNEPEGNEPASLEEPTSTEIQVEITAQSTGAYGIESKNLEFRISAASVKVNEIEQEQFKPFTLGFNLAKN